VLLIHPQRLQDSISTSKADTAVPIARIQP
jgi:hypothetical protein